MFWKSCYIYRKCGCTEGGVDALEVSILYVQQLCVQKSGYTEGGLSGWTGGGVAALEKLLYICTVQKCGYTGGGAAAIDKFSLCLAKYSEVWLHQKKAAMVEA